MALQDVINAITLLQASLAADAVNPQPSYSIDDKSVSRNEWRDNLIKTIEGLMRQQQAMQPFIYRTAQRL